MSFKKSSKRLAAAVTVAAAFTLTAATAAAGPASAEATRISLAGNGAFAEESANVRSYSGVLHGQPFSGQFTGRLTVEAESFPAWGSCAPATATLRVDDGKRYLSLTATGEVCGTWSPWGTSPDFRGRYAVDGATQRGLTRTDGFLQVRLIRDISDIYAVD